MVGIGSVYLALTLYLSFCRRAAAASKFLRQKVSLRLVCSQSRWSKLTFAALLQAKKLMGQNEKKNTG
jgi:hypothetical protein